MAPEFRYQVDEDPCEICVGPVLVLFKRDRSAQGTWSRWIPQRASCGAGCVVRDAEARIRRHIA
jgi:hypothetical protein